MTPEENKLRREKGLYGKEIAMERDIASVGLCPICVGKAVGGSFPTLFSFEEDQPPHYLWCWDVGKAAGLIWKGFHLLILADEQMLKDIVRSNTHSPEHLPHVSPSIPGIIVRVRSGVDAEPFFIAIDGSHRAALCLQKGWPFTYVLLSDEESEECLLLKPPAMATDFDVLVEKLMKEFTARK